MDHIHKIKNMVFVLILSLLLTPYLLAEDHIFLKNGTVYKGKIIFIKPDRIILRTLANNMPIKISKIKKINYENEEQTYLNIGKTYFKQSKLKQALKYYEKALNINPQSIDVKMAILELRKTLFKQKKNPSSTKNLSQTHKMDQWIESRSHLKESLVDTNSKTLINNDIGITIHQRKNNDFYLSAIADDSTASRLHLFSGDKLIAINDIKTKKKTLQELESLLLQNQSHTLTIERRIVVLRGQPRFYEGDWAWIDAKVKKRAHSFEIIFIKNNGRSDLAGLKMNDLIVKMEEQPIFTMTRDIFYKKLKGKKGSKLSFHIHRSFTVSNQSKQGKD